MVLERNSWDVLVEYKRLTSPSPPEGLVGALSEDPGLVLSCSHLSKGGAGLDLLSVAACPG